MCHKKGEKRQEFFDCLEELANEVPVDKWEEAANIPCSDEVWSLTREVVTQTLQKVFPEGKKRWPEWMMEARDWRMRLLDKRRDLRELEGVEFETVQMLLKEPAIRIAARAESGVREKRRGTKHGTTSRHELSGTARTGLEKLRNLLPKAGWGARNWTGKRTTAIM